MNAPRIFMYVMFLRDGVLGQRDSPEALRWVRCWLVSKWESTVGIFTDWSCTRNRTRTPPDVKHSSPRPSVKCRFGALKRLS